METKRDIRARILEKRTHMTQEEWEFKSCLLYTSLFIIICSMGFVFLYNYFTAVLRSMGNSFTPLIFLVISSVINIVLDYIFVVPLQMGVSGAAYATVIAQAVSAAGIAVYTLWKVKEVSISKRMLKGERELFCMIVNQSLLTSVQPVSYTHLNNSFCMLRMELYSRFIQNFQSNFARRK